MLTTYFDDSGTHDSSEVVLWSGLCGTEDQWAFLNDRWRRKLLNPSPGKIEISKFHRTDCHNSLNEFAGWSRTATDFLVQELADIIIEAGVWNRGCAVSRRDWDELVNGDYRIAWGDAEQHCIMFCFDGAVQWAKDHTKDEHMAFVFDSRPHRNAQVDKMFRIYRRAHYRDRRPEIESITFTSSARFLPLQAADLVAWEQYRYMLDYLKRGSDRNTPKSRPLAKILDTMRMNVRIVDRIELKRMFASDYGRPEIVADIARKMQMDFD
jgi:hypothetical protein